MAPVVELLVDELAYHGFATILYDVLDLLGVPTEKIEYVCWGEPRPDGFKGHIVVHHKVPASEFVPVLRAFETLEVENSIASFHPDSPCITQDSPSITLIYLVFPCLTKFHSVLLKILHK